MARGAALITGASSGIGAELAKLCAAAGYDVISVARHKAVPGARSLCADLSDPAAPQRICEELGATPVEILINNAGFGVSGPFAEIDWESEARLIQVNVAALAHLTRLFLPGMLARGSGRILNVASTAAFVPGPFMTAYYASKAFVRSFSEGLAEELRGTGVTATVLCPGPTHTGFAATAGVSAARLFHGPVMDAGDVARIGFEAMMAGRREVIAGRRNRWMLFFTRFAPRSTLAGITRRLNSAA